MPQRPGHQQAVGLDQHVEQRRARGHEGPRARRGSGGAPAPALEAHQEQHAAQDGRQRHLLGQDRRGAVRHRARRHAEGAQARARLKARSQPAPGHGRRGDHAGRGQEAQRGEHPQQGTVDDEGHPQGPVPGGAQSADRQGHQPHRGLGQRAQAARAAFHPGRPRPQDARRDHRQEHHRHQQAEQQADAQRDADAAEDHAQDRLAGHEDQRQEDHHRGHRRQGHRQGDLARAHRRRALGVQAVLAHARDVLDHHHRVVHQHADAERDAAHRQQVERAAGEALEGHRHQRRDRDRAGHAQGQPQPAQEHEQHHQGQHPAPDGRLPQLAQGRLDQVALHEEVDELELAGELRVRLELGDGLLQVAGWCRPRWTRSPSSPRRSRSRSRRCARACCARS